MRRFLARDMIVICLIGSGAIIILALTSNIALLSTLAAIFAFCIPIYVYLSYQKSRENSISEDAPDLSLQEQAKLAEGFAEGIIIINHHQRILYANTAAKTMFPKHNVGTTLPNIIQNLEVRALATDTLGGGHPAPVTFQIDRPVERHIRVMGSSMISEHRSHPVHRAIIVFYDITDLVRSNRMRADFLANASHELKTPVASLLGYIETLRGHAKDDPEAQEAFLVIMQQQAERMQRLIADLLSLRRIELIEHHAPKETADFFLATRAAIESVEPIAKSRGVTIKYQGPKNAPVIGVQDELVQLVLNLLDNAVKFAPANSTVNLTLNMLPDWEPGEVFKEDPEFGVAHKRRIVVPSYPGSAFAVLRIRDHGPGFDREHLPRLGERFYKVTDQDAAVKRGTGLGLAIVKHITLRHRGGLFVESAKDVGTKFSILLPTPPKI